MSYNALPKDIKTLKQITKSSRQNFALHQQKQDFL